MFAVDRSSTATAADAANDDFAVRQRLDSFKLGKVMPPSLSSGAPGGPSGHRHRRSHSRTASISSSSSVAASLTSSRSSGHNDLSSFSFGSLPSSSSASTMSSSGSASSSMSTTGSAPAPPSKRNSHHRRRSSVSTRRESAELMGVSLPDMPTASLDDNVNFGEKDSIRRRALWALEGKHTSFSKVEIPELTTPDVEKMMFDFSTKPPLGAGLSTGFGNSLMAGKRDSFKLLASSGSSKDQLHTLLEEEEEDEDNAQNGEKHPQDSLPSPTTSSEDHFSLPAVAPPALALTKPTPVRPRPATLNLRPLSLTPENIGGSTGLPTPSLTPSPRAGLRSLALNPTVSEDSSSETVKRTVASRRPVLNLSLDSLSSDTSSQGDDSRPSRRSSISYKSSSQSGFSLAGLPTPEMTPVLSRRCSVTESIRSSKSGDEEFFPGHPSYRPLSVSEQHFLYKSHNALLARITDLEKALSMRRMSMGGYSISGGSRPSSVLSDSSFPSEAASPAEGGPSDEMLALIRDLKEERDELKKDVDGWRTRVADLDRQLVLVAKRVENERKEAWVARSRVGLLEMEKATLEHRMEALDKDLAVMEEKKVDLEEENASLKQKVDDQATRIAALEAELAQVRAELDSERSKSLLSQDVSDDNGDDDFISTPTPQSTDGQDRWKAGLGLASEGSDDQGFNFGFPSARADVEDDAQSEEDEDCLAEYEAEEEGDSDMDTSSSFESLNNFARGPSARLSHDEAPTTDVPSRPTHRSQHSLSKVWTFPRRPSSSSGKAPADTADKFFGCFDESDASDDSGPVTPMMFDYEESKGLFARGFKYAEENEAPFYLPDGVGTIVEDAKNSETLSAVAEEGEEEDDELTDVEDDGDMFGEASGIRIIFTPPEEVEEEIEAKQIKLAMPAKPVSTPPTLPALDFGHDSDDDRVSPFNFGPSSVTETKSTVEPTVSQTPPPATTCPPSPSISTPPSSIPRPSRVSSPPSAIPRPSSRSSTAPSSPQPLRSAFVTPPSKRGGVNASSIPQPTSLPSSSRVPVSKPKTGIPPPTFMRQPSRTSPLTPSSIISKPPTASSSRNGSAIQPLNSTMNALPSTPKSQPRSKFLAGITRPKRT